MGSGSRTANKQAYPQALESAEARLIALRRSAAAHHGGSASVDKVSTEDAPAPAETLRSLLSNLRLRRRLDAADVRRLTLDPAVTKHVPLPDDTVGVGVSGGGIRSATFALGVFQALAERKLVRKIDFISTVSGGGYFGAFLGRLFTRRWIRNVDDVEHVLQGIDPQAELPAEKGWGQRAFRWLRDNGRYLAPRGSGDLLVLGAILLRNWIAVQVVLVTTVLTLFVGLQLGRMALEGVLGFTTTPASAIANVLVCDFPGAGMLWWSPWVVLALLPFVGIAVPAGWAYWLVVRGHDGRQGFPPYLGLFAACVFGLAGTVYYRSHLAWHPGWFTALLSLVPSSEGPHPDRLLIAVAILIVAALALVYWLVNELIASGRSSRTESANLVRNRLTQWLKTGLVWTGVVLAWTLVDTIGGTIYDLARMSGSSLTHWAMGLFSVFAGIGAFARQLALLLAPSKQGSRPGIPASVLSWIAAGLVATTWILAINVGSHALAWEFKQPRQAPLQLAAMARPTPLQILGADHLVVGSGDDGLQIRAARAQTTACVVAPPVERYGYAFTFAAFGGLLLLTLLFGQTRTFANMSSIHAFYAARLTRTYLGASNESRLDASKLKPIPVTDTTPGDDYSGQAYWDWPGLPAKATQPVAQPYVKGGPLHIVNTTINETFDVRTGVQNQDRKGTPLAVGPCGLSVGIRHHLISGDHGGVKVAPPADGPEHGVFSTGNGEETPDPLSLGKWMSISGAAFSAAAGANTNVPTAILAGLFNVRLGYWWDSGTVYNDGWFERVLPVQASLFAETFARTRGTAGRLWNLSDGGHFENMGGYELIRRRLPIIVIIDAEADPDYTFEGLADLIRKARLDFGAEITFLSEDQLSGKPEGLEHAALPGSVRQYFGNLEALRRGKWTNEEVPFPAAPDNKAFAIEVDRDRVSRAHAALARVVYSDRENAAWLVYVKATLMGDEPEDVSQYHRAHPAFPQEPTTDQFFDERQWESYRRLGLHVGHRVLTRDLFAFLENNPA
jgi:hypothetical protein